MKPIRIFKAALSGRYFATRSYKACGYNSKCFEITGSKDDVTEEVSAFLNEETAYLKEQLRVAVEALEYYARISGEKYQIAFDALEQIKGKK